MKDTIPTSSIFNRKLILEVRFEPNPRIIDLRGKILEELIKSKIIPNAIWELGDTVLSISDSNDQQNFAKKCFLDTNRFSVFSTYNHTNESFFHCFQTAFDIVTKNIEFDIIRIGCRIQGSYACKTSNYDAILKKFLALFPNQFLLEDFNSKDLNFQLVYQNGQYNIGPISENDEWTKKQFPNEKYRINKSGIGIDTDNYVLRENNSLYIKPTTAKDVYLTSLSVEKSLFEKLNSL